MPTLAPKDDVTQYLVAYPNGKAAIACAALLLIVCFWNAIVTIRLKTYFVGFTALTCLLEAIGYIARRQMLYTPTTACVVISQCMLVITPIFLALVDYIVVGRLLRRCGDQYQSDPRLRFIRPYWVSKLFTASDFFCLLLQASGAPMLASTNPSSQKLGNHILRLGVFLQIGIFSLFAVFSCLVYLSPALNYRNNRFFRPAFIALLSTFALMQIRNVFRAIEFVLPRDSAISKHEAFLYCFDFVPIFLCSLIFTLVHYGNFLQEPAMIVCPTADVEMNGSSDIGDENSKGMMPAQGAVAVGVQELGQKTSSVPAFEFHQQQQQQQYENIQQQQQQYANHHQQQQQYPNHQQVNNNNQYRDHFHQQPPQHYASQQAANQHPNYLQVGHQPRHNEGYNGASRSNSNNGMSPYIIAQSSNPLALVKPQECNNGQGTWI